jgi:hypothetical protein
MRGLPRARAVWTVVRNHSRPTALGALALALLLVGGVTLSRVLRPEPPTVEIVQPTPNAANKDLPPGLHSEGASPSPSPTAQETSSSGDQDEPTSEPPAEPSIPDVTPKGKPSTTAISGDGRFVAFSTWIPSDENGTSASGPVFVYDRATNKTEVASLSSKNDVYDAGPYPDISANGRYVAFVSHPDGHLRVRDRVEGTTELVTVATSGKAAAPGTTSFSISLDGHSVAFSSGAPNLVPEDTNGEEDVFVRDLSRNVTTRVSVSTEGVQGSGEFPMMSGDGRYVTFLSTATSFVSEELPTVDGQPSPQVYLHDNDTGETRLISKSSGGQPADEGAWYPTISDNGRYVTFQSQSKNLGSDASNSDVFLYDRVADSIVELLLEHGGHPHISGDGDMVAHWGGGWELWIHNISTGENRGFDRFFGSSMDFSSDHRYLTFDADWYGTLIRLVVLDLETGEEELIYEG